ncbi:MAG: hypothetical protein JO132_15385 [Streptosporangiaceae bacterium]|nr:hypothetical protein [Streptosporangiaceae bacterium]
MPLHRPGWRFGICDQAGEPLTAALILEGLVAGQPGAAWGVAVFDMDGPSFGGGR